MTCHEYSWSFISSAAACICMSMKSLTLNVLYHWKSLASYYPILLANCVCCDHVSVAKPVYFYDCLPVWILMKIWDVGKRCKQLLPLKLAVFKKKKKLAIFPKSQPGSWKLNLFALFDKPGWLWWNSNRYWNRDWKWCTSSIPVLPTVIDHSNLALWSLCKL